MNRTIHYNISKESNGFRIEQFLKHKAIPHRTSLKSNVCRKVFLSMDSTAICVTR